MKRIVRARGFTIIELLVVIAIIGILAAILLPVLLSAKCRSYEGRAATEMKNMKQALEMYERDTGYYPPDGNANMVSACLNGPNAPYMEFKEDDLDGGKYLDPWGEFYHYDENASVTPKNLDDPTIAGHNDYSFDMYSNGCDRDDDGGENDGGDKDDINNWSR